MVLPSYFTDLFKSIGKFVWAFAVTLIMSCSHGGADSTKSPEEIYSKEFLATIDSTKELYKKGKAKEALSRLSKIQDDKILPAEKALKHNLIGVIQFTEKHYAEAFTQFNEALKNSQLDRPLTAQIHLNLASTLFKQSQFEQSYSYLSIVEKDRLGESEKGKFYQLSYILCNRLGKASDALKALLELLRDKQNFSELKMSNMTEDLVSAYFKLSPSERMRILDDYAGEKLISVAFLAYKETEQRYFENDREGTLQLVEWINSNYSSLIELKEYVKDFTFSVVEETAVDPSVIGVILPLSGEKANLGKRALTGIEAAFQEFWKGKNNSEKVQLKLKDGQGIPYSGVLAVRELAEKHSAFAIIGGMTSDEAEKEFLEAKKYGVFYISLSTIYLPKEQKNHLLLEIPGSVESQIASLLSEEVLERLGRRVAILYPDTAKGKAYANELWRQSLIKNIKVSIGQSYDKDSKDFRSPVENFLGIKYMRERLEELAIWSQIYQLDKNSGRRVQSLAPVIDFDWVFFPGLPQEVMQIAPIFEYYDAKNVTFVGDPSWRSAQLVANQRKLGKLNFVGEDSSVIDAGFSKKFFERFNTAPKLIETFAYDSLKALAALDLEGASSRSELEKMLREKKEINGLTGRWQLLEGVWIKSMLPQKIMNGKVAPFIEETSNNKGQKVSQLRGKVKIAI